MPSTADQTDRHKRSELQLLDLEKIKSTLLNNKLLWIVPTVAFTIFGLLHVITKKDRWEAKQPIIVRDEAIADLGFSGNVGPLGRFESNDSLKRFVEIVFQVAKNREVAKAALEQVGPERKQKRKGYPSDEEIERLISNTRVSAAKGTEFGTTEMIYLSVVAHHPERAIAMTTALGDELEHRMRSIRRSDTDSIIAELIQKRDLAEKSLDQATNELSALEATLGSDLGEMRTLAEPGAAGDSNLRTMLTQIRTELRQAETQQTTLNQLLVMLQSFRGDAGAILAAPSRLLESQPALRRLKDGLVDAQLRTARLRGGLTEVHPRVSASLQNEKSIEAQLFSEINNSIKSVQAEVSLNDKRIASLNDKLDDVSDRLNRLAALRARYVNLVSDVNQRRERLRVADSSLAEAQGRQEASRTSSLITRIDQPTTGSRPLGPGRTTLLLGSMLAGLALGLSLVYLLAPWQERRRGRRKSDNLNRRHTDHAVPTAALNPQPAAAAGPQPIVVSVSTAGYVPSQTTS